MRIATLVCLLSAAIAHADDDTYHLIPFRGHLEQNGVPFAAPVTFHVDVFADPTATTSPPFYSEDISPQVQPTAQGDFSIVLGRNGVSGTQSITLDAALAQNPNAWVELTANGNKLTPRQRLYAAPFAARSEGFSSQLCAAGQLYAKDASGNWGCTNSVPQMTVGPSLDGSAPLHVSGAGINVDNPSGSWNLQAGLGSLGTETLPALSFVENGGRGVSFLSSPTFSVMQSTAVRLTPVTATTTLPCYGYDGSVVLTSSYNLCVCKRTVISVGQYSYSWVKTSDGVTACVF